MLRDQFYFNQMALIQITKTVTRAVVKVVTECCETYKVILTKGMRRGKA